MRIDGVDDGSILSGQIETPGVEKSVTLGQGNAGKILIADHGIVVISPETRGVFFP